MFPSSHPPSTGVETMFPSRRPPSAGVETFCSHPAAHQVLVWRLSVPIQPPTKCWCGDFMFPFSRPPSTGVETICSHHSAAHQALVWRLYVLIQPPTKCWCGDFMFPFSRPQSASVETLFNKIKQDLPSKPKAHMASGQGSHWLIESPTMFIYL